MVDASQGVEAQTVANCYTAIDLGVEVLPVLNKIDLPSAEPDRVCQEIEVIIGLDAMEAVHCSAKTGQGLEDVLELVIKKIPAPKGDINKPLKALIVDSWFDNYVGVVMLVRVVDGTLKPKDKIKLMSNNANFWCESVGVFTPKSVTKPSLSAGQVGFVIAGIKELQWAKVGDTITLENNPADTILPGFKEIQPKVFAGLYPVESHDYESLRDSLEKLKLNDASLQYDPEVSQALGFGFRCGFLGMLHMEIIQERLEREFNQTVITTVPNVSFIAFTTKGERIVVNNPTEMPDPVRIERIEEPFIQAQIITKPDYIGNIMTLCLGKRGNLVNQSYLTPTRVELTFEMPLTEIVFDFYDKLKSQTRGYASFDYHPIGNRDSDIVKMDILLNGDKVDALSALIHRARSGDFGRKLCEKLKELVPRQQFQIAIQAAIGAKVVARETISAMRKDVTAKCYGGDISRKRKLLEKQKEGKKRMRQIGNVEVPQEAFLAVLKLDE